MMWTLTFAVDDLLICVPGSDEISDRILLVGPDSLTVVDASLT